MLFFAISRSGALSIPHFEIAHYLLVYEEVSVLAVNKSYNNVIKSILRCIVKQENGMTSRRYHQASGLHNWQI